MPRISPNCQKAVLAFAALLAASPRFAAASVVGQWNLNAGGFWSSAASWAGGLIPDAPGDAAIFGPILADPAGATISLDGNRVLSSLTFNSTAGSYFLSSTSAGSLLFQSTTASATPGINVIAGQHRLDIPVLASGNLLVNMTGSPSMPTQLAITRMIQSAGSVTLNGTNASISDFVFTGSTSGITGSVIAMGTANGVTRVTVDGANLQSSYDQPSLGSIKIGAGDGSSTYLKLISGRIATTGWGEMWLGERSSNSSFTALSMTGGTITVANSFLVVGNGNDRAIFNMSGGQTSTSVMTLGTGYDPVNPDSIGVANISGGTLTALTSIGSYTGIYAGEIGSGVLNISGSAVVAASTIQYGNIYKYPSVSGIVNLLGGTLTAGIFKMASTLSIGSFVNFNGGVLRPLGSTTTFMSGLNGAYVYQNGAVIDDGGYAVTISQPLLAPTGNGVAAISVSGGTGYIDTPMVLISRGAGDSTGTGAAAIANVDSSGHLTGITITNPGVGYTTTPVVTLVGGSGLGALVGSLTLSPSASGGLTKRGNGTLTLSATETYTGPTIVNSGVLVVSGALNAASSVTVQGGAGLRGTGTVAGPVTLAAGPTPDTQGSIASNTQPEMFMLLGGLTAGGTAGSASVLNFDIGGPATGNDLLVLQNSPFTVNPGGAVIRLNNLGNIVPGTYILMGFNNATAPSNVSLDTSTLGLYNATLNVSSTAISVTIGGHAYPAKAYWTGAYSNKWNGAGGPGLDQANFVSAASGGTNTLQVPGPSTDVFFAPGLSNTLNTNLGQNMMIRSLTISPGTGAVTIGGPGYLQLTSGVLSVASDSSLIVNADVILANTQTWTNSNPGAVLQINGKDLLTTGVSFTASGNFQLNSDWSNFGGTLTVAAGTFQLANGGIIGPTIVDNGTFVVSSLNSIDTTGTFRYNITGFGNVVFDIPGDILHFQSANNYAGQTTLKSGTLTLEGTVLPFSPKITVMADATLVSYISLSKNLSGTGTVAFNLFQSDLSLTGAWDFAGTITSTRDAFYNSRLIFSGTNSHSVGIVTGSGSLQIAANSALTSDGITLDNLIVSGTHTIRPNPLDTGTSKLNFLALAAATTGSFTATLNLNNNKLILQSTDDADKAAKSSFLNAALLSGLGLPATATWTGPGINSATVAIDQSATGSHTATLALFDNADLGLSAFGGQAVNSSSLLITTALIGDTNLDHHIDTADLDTLASHWQTLQTPASRGNLNFDAGVDAADLALVQSHWQSPTPFEIAAASHANIATTLGTITISDPYTYTGPITIAAGTLLFANASAPRQTAAILLTTNALNITAPAAVLDLTNHDLMLTNNTPSSSNTIINTLWKNGTAALTGNGDPSGPQITSSTATNNTSSFPTFIVAFDLDRLFGNGTTGDGSAIGQNLGAYADNQPITQPGTIMIKYGYYADLDFSGKVDAGDINLILGALGQTTPGLADPGLAYLLGDLDYSGKVDAGDINLVLGMLGAGSGGAKGNPLATLDPPLTSPITVPEPGSLVLLIGALPFACATRRIRHTRCPEALPRCR